MSAALVLVLSMQVAPADLVTGPIWLRKPSGEDVARVHPRAALQQSLIANAQSECRVDEKGRLIECTTLSEDPPGLGAGAAALKLMPLFKMRPTDSAGRSVVGQRIRIPVRFVVPADAQMAAMQLRSDAAAGARLEMDCRYSGDRLDNCVSTIPQNVTRETVDAAKKAVESMRLPTPARRVGRVRFPVDLVAGR